MANEKFTDVEILSEYYAEISKIVSQSEQFRSVSDYVNFVLKEMLFGDENPLSNEEADDSIKKRLQDLGYL